MPAVTLATLVVDPSFVGGATARGSLTLTGPAPTGGIAVTLAVDNPAAVVPATVTVAAGQTEATFAISSQRVTRTVDLLLTARSGDVTRTAQVRVRIDASGLQPSSSVTLSMSGLGPNQARVTRYSEAGFTLSTSVADWIAVTTYGRPAPSLQFFVSGGVTLTGEVTITADSGAPFWLDAIDFYSSVTPIPYELEGFLSGQSVYRVENRLGNTFGNFVTASNPQRSIAVDSVIVRLQNPAISPCCSNPVGLDNIALRR